jgi:hypothetical protein
MFWLTNFDARQRLGLSRNFFRYCVFVELDAVYRPTATFGGRLPRADEDDLTRPSLG